MTQSAESTAGPDLTSNAQRSNPSGAAAPGPRLTPWWRTGVLPAALLSVAFLAYAVPPYATLDPDKSRIHIHKNYWFHYPALVGHIAFGTVAITAVVFQMWTWLRLAHPRVHRAIGRVYIFGGVLPAGLLGILIIPFAGGPAGDAVEAAFWLGSTFAALRYARLRRFAEHRRWMMYSYALCAQVVWGRILIISLTAAAPGWLNNNWPLVLNTASWIGMLINLLVAQWWYERTASRPILYRLPA